MTTNDRDIVSIKRTTSKLNFEVKCVCDRGCVTSSPRRGLKKIKIFVAKKNVRRADDSGAFEPYSIFFLVNMRRSDASCIQKVAFSPVVACEQKLLNARCGADH